MFTPKLWEAKWIVDEVSCNFQCFNDVIWAKNDHKLREWLKEASIHLKIPIILKSHLATSFGNVRLQERKITTQKERVEYMANSTQKKNRAISWQTYSFQYMEFLRNEEELTSVQVSPALWQGCAKKKANNGSSYLFCWYLGTRPKAFRLIVIIITCRVRSNEKSTKKLTLSKIDFLSSVIIIGLD